MMTQGKASDNEIFITLVSAAKKDIPLAQKILAITRMSELDRKVKVLELVNECANQNAPKEFISALTFLGDEAIARRVSEFLEKEN